MNYKQKALDHVRSVCDLKDEPLKDGYVWQETPHLEHWLKGINSRPRGRYPNLEITENGTITVLDISASPVETEFRTSYNLLEDGENQSEGFYKAYCNIVGV